MTPKAIEAQRLFGGEPPKERAFVAKISDLVTKVCQIDADNSYRCTSDLVDVFRDLGIGGIIAADTANVRTNWHRVA